MNQKSEAGTLPLSGLKVIELHAIGPVPFAGMNLLGMGADVTRVSPPTDPGLGVGTKAEFDVLNMGKRTAFIDLKSAQGQQQVNELLSHADILLEGFRPGVLERLSLGPDTLRERHPKLVLGRLSGWGYSGELSPRAGHDINYLAMAGVLHAIGPKDTPSIPLNVVADYGGGAMHLLVGVLAKLVQRSITGVGGVAQTSIEAGTIGLTPMFFGLMAAGKWTMDRAANLLDGGAPFYHVYETADNKHVAVGAIEPKFYAHLLALTGLTDSVDASRQFDPASYADTIKQLSASFATKTRDEWGELAKKTDCCVAPVLNFAEAAKAQHNLDNGWYSSDPYDKPTQMIDFT